MIEKVIAQLLSTKLKSWIELLNLKLLWSAGLLGHLFVFSLHFITFLSISVFKKCLKYTQKKINDC